MKKTFIISAMAIAALTACSVDESSVIGDGNTRTITFRGTAFPDTRTSIGSPENGSYPVLWTRGDQIGIYGMLGGFLNVPATLNDDDAGLNSGVFVLNTTEQTAAEAQDLIIYYPYNTATEYSEGALHSVIPQEQRQSVPGNSEHTGQYALAYAKTSIEAAGTDGNNPPVEFSLTHAVAYVKFVVSSSQFSSLRLCGVSLYSKGAHISGDISANVDDGTVTGIYQRDYATVIVDEPEALSSAQELWLVTVPCDLTGKETIVSVSMTDGTTNTTIPMKMNIGQLKANAVNTIEIEVSDADVATDFPWYETQDDRALAGGWAYGPENTYIVTESQPEVIIDVKARGYYTGIEEPKYVAIMAGEMTYASRPCLEAENSTPGSYYIANNDSHISYSEIGSGYTVRAKAIPTATTSVSFCGKIAIYNENHEALWAYTIWLVRDANPIQEEQYRNGIVMDRYLGGLPPQEDGANAFGTLYQWGRPFAFPWATWINTSAPVRDLKTSATNQNVFFMSDNVENSNRDWWTGDATGARTDRKDDFWGNPNDGTGAGSSENGEKTVFDPCPEGWMVASPAILKEVLAGKDADITAGSAMSWVTYRYSEEQTSYWALGGFKNGANGGNEGSRNVMLAVWSNSPYSGYDSTEHNAYDMYFDKRNEGTWNDNAGRAYGFSVRCMKVQ